MEKTYPGETANTDNVVTMNHKISRENQPIVAQLFDYWEGLRASRAAPKRSEIDPRALKSILGHVFILERTRFGGTRFRLAGTEICDLMGMELRGMQISAMFAKTAREELDLLLKEIYRSTALYSFKLNTTQVGYRKVSGHMVLLPLKDECDRTTRVLGAVSLNRELLRPPVSFEIEQVFKNRIVPNEFAELPAQGFAESPLAFFQDRKDPTAGPSLRLVVDNDALN
ncbi:MAG: PAS domain-containing protein [Pseudomonadota bacterium]